VPRESIVHRLVRARPAFRFTDRIGRRAGDAPSLATPDRPWRALTTAATFGLTTGLVELVILLIRHRVEASSALGALQMNRHFAWMVPLSHLVVFLLAAIPGGLCSLVSARLSRRLIFLAPLALSSFALLSLVPGLYAWAIAILAAGIAFKVAPILEKRISGFRRTVKFGLPTLLGITGAIGLWSYDRHVLGERRALSALPKAASGAPNVLLIVLDTVRADHLSLYGYERDTTPNLRRWANRGVVFEEARSPAPWTFPSHCTLFTGRWPHELRIGGNRPLDGAHPTLAEEFSKQGYAAAGFIGNTYYCNSWYGLGRGFTHYEDYYEENVVVSPTEALRCTALGRWLIRQFGAHYHVRAEAAIAQKDAVRVNRDFLRWTSAHRDRPFFAFLNYIDAHDPYQTPAGYAHHFGLIPATPDEHRLIQEWHTRDKSNLTTRELALIRDAYDDCLFFLDEHLGRLFDEMERRGILHNTVVAIVSDHGEELGDHGLFEHGQSLYRPETHVPLVLFGGGGVPEGRRFSRPVSLRDVPATLLEYALGSGSRTLPGNSLSRYWRDGVKSTDGIDDVVMSEAAIHPRPAQRPSAAAAPSFRGPMASIVERSLVYIRDGFGDEELYDFAADPNETQNLAGSPSAKADLERLRAALNEVGPKSLIKR
jgi:arylsulfatase A-like enzyme